MLSPKVYTPEQVAGILQLSTNTVYELIRNGEIPAKKLGRVYRIPPGSISFAFSGLDPDLEAAQENDLQILPKVRKTLSAVRARL